MKIKKIMLSLLFFLFVALLMELLIDYLNKDEPEIHLKVIALTYKNNEYAKKIGKFKTFEINYTPMNFNKDTVLFDMTINGDKGFISCSGETIKFENKWKIINLRFIK
ncbi:hypothetical protein VB776_17550 [Arcicella sp. DC2W]|uniref:DUF3139 domain-containing protein n=1 Tax=Arcicella gelida TaxID=2984195 RepID=A0ABU5S8E0_9BACT|nr:hypothetical protein [Arcicella sp. DC2W]MEA5404744.1 hypothetical protein [Arcicella sp. DC2W]